MASYELITTIKSQYTIIASDIQSIRIWRFLSRSYLYAFVKAGDPAPTERGDGVPLFRDNEPDYDDFSYDAPVDVYIYTIGDEDGSIRADVGGATISGAGPSGIGKIPIDQFLAQDNDIPTTLLATAVVDTRQLQVTDPSSFSIGDVIVVGIPGIFYAGTVLGVVGDLVNVDALINYAFPAGSAAISRTRDLNVDGSVTPQVFSINIPPFISTARINLSNFIMKCLTTSAVDLSKFGDIPGGVTFGIMLRGVPAPSSGIPQSNSWIAKTNAELANLVGTGDFEIYDAQNLQQGQHGFIWRYTYGGEGKHDVLPQLQGLDEIQLIVQDNLTSLLEYKMIYRGNAQI